MIYSQAQIWLLIVAIGLGSFLLRFSFLGLLGNRELPDWLTRHLRYTPVAVLPGMVAPLILFPAANGGQTDPLRLIAIAATLAVGLRTGNVLWAIATGMGLLMGLQAFVG